MTLTLLSHVTMSTTYRDHSFTTTAYLMNMYSKSALPDSMPSFPTVYHKQPVYKSPKIFSCACYLHMRTYNQHKLQSRSYKCVYLGVSPTHKGHKCINMEGNFFISNLNVSKASLTQLSCKPQCAI